MALKSNRKRAGFSSPHLQPYRLRLYIEFEEEEWNRHKPGISYLPRVPDAHKRV